VLPIKRSRTLPAVLCCEEFLYCVKAAGFAGRRVSRDGHAASGRSRPSPPQTARTKRAHTRAASGDNWKSEASRRVSDRRATTPSQASVGKPWLALLTAGHSQWSSPVRRSCSNLASPVHKGPDSGVVRLSSYALNFEELNI
jgi:hypothetical protein